MAKRRVCTSVPQGGVRKERGERDEVFLPLKMKLALSHRSKGMAFAEGLILLRVERLPLQVDLAEL